MLAEATISTKTIRRTAKTSASLRLWSSAETAHTVSEAISLAIVRHLPTSFRRRCLLLRVVLSLRYFYPVFSVSESILFCGHRPLLSTATPPLTTYNVFLDLFFIFFFFIFFCIFIYRSQTSCLRNFPVFRHHRSPVACAFNHEVRAWQVLHASTTSHTIVDLSKSPLSCHSVVNMWWTKELCLLREARARHGLGHI